MAVIFFVDYELSGVGEVGRKAGGVMVRISDRCAECRKRECGATYRERVFRGGCTRGCGCRGFERMARSVERGAGPGDRREEKSTVTKE